VPVLSSTAVAVTPARFARVWIPLGTLITAWEFLRANGARGHEQLCFLAGRIVGDGGGIAAQVTSCVLPVTLAKPGYVTLTSHAQTAIILDHLEARSEIPILSIHTHGDGGERGCGPEHSAIDDRGVTLGPEDGVFSAVVPYYALGSPFAFPAETSIYERLDGTWRRLDPTERAARVIVHGDTLRFSPVRPEEDDT
jgi:hypothetical protein